MFVVLSKTDKLYSIQTCNRLTYNTFTDIPIFDIYFITYFFGYKTEFFSFQNNPKDLDPSYKTDLDLWDCLGRVKLVL